MKTRLGLLRLLMALAVGLAITCQSFALNYVFTRIVDNTESAPYGTFELFGTTLNGGLAPAVSNGVVLYGASYSTIPGVDTTGGIFTSSQGTIQTIVQNHDPVPGNPALFFDWVGDPTISQGTVAFSGQYLFSRRTSFTSNGGVMAAVADPSDPPSLGTSSFMGPPVISGQNIGFVAGRVPFSNPGLFVKGPDGFTTISQVGNPAPNGSFNAFLDYSLSNHDMSFRAYFDSYGREGIFVGNGGPVTKVVASGEPAPTGVFTSFRRPGIADGQVVFWAAYDGATQEGIFSEAGGILTTVAKNGDVAPSGGTFTGFQTDEFTGPSIIGDSIAFQASTSSGTGVYLSTSNQLTTVLSTGQPLFGSTIQSLLFGSYGLNTSGSGSLVFRYTLADGRFGVAMATLVPEPSAHWLALFPLVAPLFGSWRRQKCATFRQNCASNSTQRSAHTRSG
jgi:hypothetical protein